MYRYKKLIFLSDEQQHANVPQGPNSQVGPKWAVMLRTHHHICQSWQWQNSPGNLHPGKIYWQTITRLVSGIPWCSCLFITGKTILELSGLLGTWHICILPVLPQDNACSLVNCLMDQPLTPSHIDKPKIISRWLWCVSACPLQSPLNACLWALTSLSKVAAVF